MNHGCSVKVTTDGIDRCLDAYQFVRMNKIRPEVIQRILLAKEILSSYRFAWSEPDAYIIAMQLLAAHDAADLVFAAIVDYQGGGTSKSRGLSMMQSLGAINTDANSRKPTTYFGQLSEARDSLKHRGNLPNTKQWANAGRTVYDRLSEMSEACLDLSLDDIDESALLTDDQVKNYFAAAQKAAELGEHKTALEELGKALYVLLDKNRSLGKIPVGVARAEDAIKLSGFGVHANDFLRLQEFLPSVSRVGILGQVLGDGSFGIAWKQSQFGHPGNWHEDSVQFCLQAFLNVAPRIQEAKRIPLAIEFFRLYKYKVTANEDDVEIFLKGRTLDGSSTRLITVGHLKKDEPRVFMSDMRPLVFHWWDESQQEFLKVVRLYDDSDILDSKQEFVLFDKVTITCIPRDTDLMRAIGSPDLVEIPFTPDVTTLSV